MMDPAMFLQKVIIWGLPIVLAITLHEAAHGYVAKMRGDSTAWMLGRVTLNPLKHIDPFGTVLLPLLLMAFSPFIIGYAKPVPVNFMNLRDIKWDSVLVALAGPAANLVLLLLSIGWLWLAYLLPHTLQTPFVMMGVASIQLNLIIMLFNLLPILPLDGGRVLHALLPPRLGMRFAATERYGLIIVLLLAFTGVLWIVLNPLMQYSLMAITPLLPPYMLG